MPGPSYDGRLIHHSALENRARTRAMAFRVAGNLACRRPFRPPSPHATNFSGFAWGPLRHTKPSKRIRLGRLVSPGSKSRLKGGCTVESLVLVGPHVGPDGIRRPIGNRPVRVFIPFGGAKRHADRQDCLPHLASQRDLMTGQRRGANCARRLDKLKHVLPRSAEMSLGAAGRSACATSQSARLVGQAFSLRRTSARLAASCRKAREIRQTSQRPAEAGRRLNACPTGRLW